ncbi:MAG: hypothetical protein AAFT19_03235 [Pseudomonadota bacterium]
MPLTLPGERVRLAPTDDPRRARAIEIIDPSPDRIAPVCRHFDSCGGCTLQHMAPSAVAAFKRDLICRALAAEGITAEVVPTITVPERSRRRLALGARRVKHGAVIGHRAARSSEIVAIEECPLATPPLEAAILRLGPLVEALASRRGTLRLTLTESAAGIDCAVDHTATPPPAAAAPRGTRHARPQPQAEADRAMVLAGIAERLDLARLSVNGSVVALRRAPLQRLGVAQVLPPPGAFLQPSRAGALILTRLVDAALLPALDGAGPFVDLFAGSGTFALPLSARVPIRAYEGEADAVEALHAAWRSAAPTAGLRRLDAIRRDLFRRPVLAEELKDVAGAVIDPPFAGAEAQARALATSTVPRIASVSCNPTTFARDARHLIDGGYRLERVTPVDQFRWSAHVELVGTFRHRDASE